MNKYWILINRRLPTGPSRQSSSSATLVDLAAVGFITYAFDGPSWQQADELMAGNTVEFVVVIDSETFEDSVANLTRWGYEVRLIAKGDAPCDKMVEYFRQGYVVKAGSMKKFRRELGS